MKNRNYIVYIHTNKFNKKRYIGITGQRPESRWKKNGVGYKNQLLFYRAITKYGWDNFTHEIIYDNLTKEEACDIEIWLIALFNSSDSRYGYNNSTGGENSTGYKHTIESRKKMSESHKGKTINDETRKKMSEVKKGVKKSEDTKEKMSEYAKNRTKEHQDKLNKSQIGRKASLEARKHMSEAHIGKTNELCHNSKKVAQYTIDGELVEIWPSASEAGRQGYNQGSISRVCRGERNHYKGYYWKYLEED